jgi:hypothetical protein
MQTAYYTVRYIPCHNFHICEELLDDVFCRVGAAVPDVGMSYCISCIVKKDALNYGSGCGASAYLQ